jgi:hypothetical protein
MSSEVIAFDAEFTPFEKGAELVTVEISRFPVLPAGRRAQWEQPWSQPVPGGSCTRWSPAHSTARCYNTEEEIL